MFALEDDRLLDHSISCLLWRRQHEQVLSDQSKDHKKEFVDDLSTGCLDEGRVAGHNKSNHTNKTGDKTKTLNPVVVNETQNVILLSVVRLV